MNRSTMLALTVIGIVATLTIIWLAGGDDGRVRPALAGPCGADPELVFQSDPNTLLDEVHLYAIFLFDGTFTKGLTVETLPEVLPPGKPPVTIEAVPVDGHAGIEIAFFPGSSDGSFDTTIGVNIANSVPNDMYEYDIVMVCHEQETHIPFFIWVGVCPAPFGAQGFVGLASGNGSPEPTQPFPDECAAPSPSPSGSATPTGSVTPTGSATPEPSHSVTPTPSDTPVPGLKRGDVDCSGAVLSVDALKILRWIAQLPPNQPEGCPPIGDLPTPAPTPTVAPSPTATPTSQQFGAGGAVAIPFGDMDCSGSVTSVDALKILRFVVQLPVSQTEPCTDIGT